MRRLVPPGWRVLAVPDFRRLWLAHAGSIVGDGFHSIAITWLLLQTLGGGPQALAIFGIANVIPALALGILSGTIVDRLNLRRVMIASDLVRALVVAALAIMVAAGNASVPVVILCSVALTIAGLFFYPARNSVMPRYVDRADLVPANALMSATTQSANLIAPAIGGILFVAIGPVGLFVVNAASFVWSAALISRIATDTGNAPVSMRRPLFQEALDGLRFIGGHAPSRLVVATTAANQLFAAGPWRILVPTWVTVALGGGAAEYGTLLSIFAVGTLVANLTVSGIRARLPLLTIIPAGVFLDGLIELFFAYSPTFAIAGAALFALGVSNAVLNASSSALLQASVPMEMRGRTFATFGTAGQITTPLSLALTGALASAAGPVALLALSGIGLMGVGIASYVGSLRIAPEAVAAP